MNLPKLIGIGLVVASLALTGCSASGNSPEKNGSATGNSNASNFETIKPGVLQAVTMSDGAPFASVKDNEWTGYEVELLRILAEKLDLDVEFTARDFDALIPTVSGRQADLAFVSIADIDSRREVVDFTLPDYTGTNNLIVKNDSPLADREQQRGEKVDASVTGNRVGVLQASNGLLYAQNYFTEAELVTFPNNNAAMAALNSDNVDSVLLDGQSAYLFAEQYPVHTAFTTIDPNNRGAALVISKEAPNLRQALNAELRKVLADGTLEKLLKEYNPAEPSEPVIEFLEEYYANYPNDSYPY